MNSLVSHSNVLLFSAAIPLQGGSHHVNEQWPDYWRSLFLDCGFEMLDFIRGRIWADTSIHLWLRQNVFLVVKKELAEHGSVFSRSTHLAPPLSVVHPDLYVAKMREISAVIKETGTALQEFRNLKALLSRGGDFSVRLEPNGQITVTRK